MANEKILIDANRLKRRLERFEEFMVEFGNVEAAKATRAIINGLKIEPIVDAVEVVRCKDCKWFWKYKINNNYCCCRNSRDGYSQVFEVKFSENDFCSYGERRTDG